MPIATPQGTLDFKSVDTITFVGASSNTVIDTTTGSLGVGVDVNGPTSNLHVVGNAFVSSNLTVSGKFIGDGSALTGISSNLQVITDFGNVTSNTVQFTNATTGFVTTANVEVGGELTVSGNVAVTGTGALTVPAGTTAQRPTTGVQGMVRYNTGDSKLEMYMGTDWVLITSSPSYGETFNTGYSFTFTNAGVTGYNGPTLSNLTGVYSPDWTDNINNLSVSGGIQQWTVPATATYRICLLYTFSEPTRPY